jgi:hypothetical protein
MTENSGIIRALIGVIVLLAVILAVPLIIGGCSIVILVFLALAIVGAR